MHRLGPGVYEFFFAEEDRNPVFVLWDEGGSAPPADVSGPVRVTDLYGHETDMNGEDLTLSPVPVFVEKR